MGRWTQYDEDDYRLPEGMKRIGYDSDTQKYTFKDQNGDLWEGPEGAEFGELTKVGQSGPSSNDLEATIPARADGYQPLAPGEGEVIRIRQRDAWRQLLPFFLIIAVFILLVFRLSPSFSKLTPISCPDQSRSLIIKSGDTCWDIAQEYQTTLEVLHSLNPKVDCASLRPGQRLCVPVEN
ncbi:carbohydrate-binding module family 50 [Pyrrhoderma noxium]|uniref:Carbohydrate-binding module family 50 n=1 Tax=Pyrrhoderma noxium TaxID=2282107 RepID=A0A286UR84_9AGAM|nr:carbohydrate-binding module family 50 [Pyrrhoderma noxium]